MIFKVRNVYSKLSFVSCPRRFLCSASYCETSHGNSEYEQFQQPSIENRTQVSDLNKYSKETKLLKVALVGRPNAGKSTLINQLMGRKICPISCKQHTTRISARCVQTEGLTQLVYLDTPGLVTEEEFKRFKFEESFKKAVHNSLNEADVIGVVHDADNTFTREHLDPVIVDLLTTFKSKNSFLVINKVDLLKKKRHLFYMTLKLTKEVSQKENTDEKNSWPHFEDIFYVSAQTGDGVGDIKAYLMMQAHPAKWLFKPDTITDLPLQKLIVNTLQASLLDTLAYEIPRNAKVSLNTLDKGEDGSVHATLTVWAAKKRHCPLIVGPNGMTLRKIAVIAERSLASALRAPAQLKIKILTKDDQ